MLKIPKVLNVPPEGVRSALIRAREVDPGCEETAVRAYLREIQEAEAELDAVDLRGVPVRSSFSALWEDERAE